MGKNVETIQLISSDILWTLNMEHLICFVATFRFRRLQTNDVNQQFDYNAFATTL